METTRYKDIYSHLAESGFEVYTPAQKEGECKAPYIVVKDAGTTQYNQFSTTRTLYDVMCYVPKNQFTKLEEYVSKVKESMKGLEPMIKPVLFETASFYDDTVDAHMISIQYYNYRKV